MPSPLSQICEIEFFAGFQGFADFLGINFRLHHHVLLRHVSGVFNRLLPAVARDPDPEVLRLNLLCSDFVHGIHESLFHPAGVAGEGIRPCIEALCLCCDMVGFCGQLADDDGVGFGLVLDRADNALKRIAENILFNVGVSASSSRLR